MKMTKIIDSFNIKEERNLSMLMDFYELTMSNGYFENGVSDTMCISICFTERIRMEQVSQ